MQITLHTACALARIYAKSCLAGSVRLLMSVGISLQWATRYVLQSLRAARGAL